MKYETVCRLREILKQYCPVDSGALKLSILKVQGSENEYTITIGNNGGKEINGKCATIEYAAKTNFQQTLKVFAGGKRKDPKKPNFKYIKNPNYHWVNDAISVWAMQNAPSFKIASEEYEEEDLEEDDL